MYINKQALAFLIVSIHDDVKLPIGYFLTNSLPGVELAELVTQALTKTAAVGCRVRAIVCDGAKENFAALETLGATFVMKQNDGQSPNFDHPAMPGGLRACMSVCV